MNKRKNYGSLFFSHGEYCNVTCMTQTALIEEEEKEEDNRVLIRNSKLKKHLRILNYF